MQKWWKSGTARVVGIALGTVVVHLATGWRYGFDRDELMALEDARHLAWGYVQYPPMTAFFGWVALKLFGTSLEGFRFFAAVVQAVALVLTGWMAKEIARDEARKQGGKEVREGEWAMVVAALAGVPFCLGGGALMQYISFDYVSWVLVAYGMVKLLGSEDARWWLVVGAGIGLGMMAKYTMGFLVAGVVAGVLLTSARRYLKSGWLWGGVLVALGIFLPNVVWEWKRSFVSMEFLRFVHERDVATGVTNGFFVGQLELMMLALPLAVVGLWFYFFADEGRRFRAAGWMYAVPLVLLVAMRGRDYYLAPAYPMLYAAGAVWVERRNNEVRRLGSNEEEIGKWEIGDGAGAGAEETKVEIGRSKIGRGGEPSGAKAEEEAERDVAAEAATHKTREIRKRTVGWWIRRGVVAALLVDVVVAGAVALPIAPVNSGWWKVVVKRDIAFPDEIGWEEFVGSVAQVWERLPSGERARAGIMAGNYGEVGALNLYGEKYGLPWAISGVNSSWERGHGNPAPETVIVAGYPREFLEKYFASCEVGARTWNRYGVANEETLENPEIFVCRELRGSWEEFWRAARKFA